MAEMRRCLAVLLTNNIRLVQFVLLIVLFGFLSSSRTKPSIRRF